MPLDGFEEAMRLAGHVHHAVRLFLRYIHSSHARLVLIHRRRLSNRHRCCSQQREQNYPTLLHKISRSEKTQRAADTRPPLSGNAEKMDQIRRGKMGGEAEAGTACVVDVTVRRSRGN